MNISTALAHSVATRAIPMLGAHAVRLAAMGQVIAAKLDYALCGPKESVKSGETSGPRCAEVRDLLALIDIGAL